MRTRPRNNHHQTQIEQSNFSNNEISKEPPTQVLTQFQPTSAKHRHNALSINTTGDEEQAQGTSNNLNDSVGTSSVFNDKNQKYSDDDVEYDNEEDRKKNKSFRYRSLRRIQNLRRSSKKVCLSIVITTFILLIFKLESSSSGNHSDMQKRLDTFLNYWVGGVANHPIRALCMYMCLYIIVLGKSV